MTNEEFPPIGGEGWLADLPAYQKSVINELLSAGKTEEEVAEYWLNRAGADNNVGFGTGGSLKTYYTNLREELDAFICGEARYEKERSEAAVLWNKGGKPAVVAFVTTVVAPQVGLAAAALIPAVALTFSVIGRAGVAAYCKTRRER